MEKLKHLHRIKVIIEHRDWEIRTCQTQTLKVGEDMNDDENVEYSFGLSISNPINHGQSFEANDLHVDF